MEAHMDSPKFFLKKYVLSTKVLITQSFFELQTPDFAWKFIWTVQPSDRVQKVQNSTKIQKRKKAKNAKKYKFKNIKRIKGTKVQNFFNLEFGQCSLL